MNPIDIVIPCAGRVHDLLRLLASIEACCADSLPLQVASITASDDRHAVALGEQIAAAHPQVRYVAGPARGPAANRNHGARQGQADWILFLDDDCYLETDLLAAYLRQVQASAAEGSGIEAFEGAIHPVGDRPDGNHHAPINRDGGYLWSCNMLIRRSAFEAVGGFDEAFPYACMEDADLMLRLRERGTPMRFVPDAVVFHPWRSVGEREVRRGIASHAIYAEKHPEFARGWTWLHLLRAMRGRVHQYRAGRFRNIPLAKARTVALDLLAPLLIYLLMCLPALRRAVGRRHRNVVAAG